MLNFSDMLRKPFNSYNSYVHLKTSYVLDSDIFSFIPGMHEQIK